MYNWGVLVGVMVAVQIVSGVIIAWSYVASYECTFLVLDYMLRDGELMFVQRACHANGAALVFLFMYLHLIRSFVFGVASRVHPGVFTTGVIVLLVMMGIAFMGYVLP
jgi:quinol-cytochrome oxidoreductase complex cytochrome b subunit